MKTILVSLALFALSLSTVRAQTEKGRWTAGVSVGNFAYQDNNGSKAFTGNLTPSAGYFVADNLLIGTGVPLSLASSKSGPSNPYLLKSVSTGVGLSPFVRYYFGKSALKPYAGVSYSYTYMHYAYTVLPIFGDDVSGDGYSTSLVPTVGAAYFINRNIVLNAGLNYSIINSKIASFSPTSVTSSRIFDNEIELKALSLSIGFQIFFGR